MENKKELFDLQREKRELDAFLSTFVETDASLSHENIIQPKETSSYSAEIKLELESAPREISGLEMETPAPKFEETPEPAEIKLELESAPREISGLEMETPAPKFEEAPEPAEIKLELESAPREISGLEMERPAPKFEEAGGESGYEEKVFVPDDQEMRSGLTDTMAIRPPEPMQERETAPSFEPFEEEKKAEIPTERTDVQDTQTPEDFETATRFDETTQSDEPVMSKTPPPEEEKIPPKPAPEKKAKKTNAYDFAPENKSTGMGKWLWAGISILLLIAALVGYFLFSPLQGGKIMEVIKSYIPLSKTDQGNASASVQGINLIQVRQKLIHNERLRKNIRVLEGLVENSTDRPVSRIKIAANLYNAEGVVLSSTESYGGNIIIDEKLESLDANGILAALKDVKTMEDRVQPRGQIPFMIVFTSAPSEVFRVAALPVDLKKH
jgi:hypothetical protein